MIALDLLGREIHVNDYVMYGNEPYRVVRIAGHSVGPLITIQFLYSQNSMQVYDKWLCIISEEDVVVWKIKNGKDN